MYIPDGANQDYGNGNKSEIYYAWGWIGDNIVNSGYNWKDSNERLIFLKNLEHIPDCDAYMGMHSCQICGVMLGNCSKKLKYNGKTYVCPNKVAHYIHSHNYIPPKEVIQAILK
jgi:hypothetical protein